MGRKGGKEERKGKGKGRKATAAQERKEKVTEATDYSFKSDASHGEQ